MPAPITINVTGLDQQIVRIASLQKKLMSMDMSPAINRMGEVWRNNFVGEGNSVGGWDQLGEATNRVRETRGYAPEHPILKQSGALEQAVIDFPASFRGKHGTMIRPGVSAWISTGYGTVNITAEGSKVENQYGSTGDIGDGETLFRPGPTSWTVPARPFWFLNAEVEKAATDGIEQSIKDVLENF